MIYVCMHLSIMPLKLPIQSVLAVKLLSWRCSAIQLDEVGSATASLLSIVQFLLVCQASSRCKDRKGVQHVWKFETRLF